MSRQSRPLCSSCWMKHTTSSGLPRASGAWPSPNICKARLTSASKCLTNRNRKAHSQALRQPVETTCAWAYFKKPWNTSKPSTSTAGANWPAKCWSAWLEARRNALCWSAMVSSCRNLKKSCRATRIIWSSQRGRLSRKYTSGAPKASRHPYTLTWSASIWNTSSNR